MANVNETSGLSSKRKHLCSRENAVRVARRIFDDRLQRVSITCTGDPIQPYLVSTDPGVRDTVVMEMVA